MNLILLTSEDVDASGTARLEGDRARHVRDVLRATPGQSLRVGLVDGPFGVGTVVSATAAGVELNCVFGDVRPDRPIVDVLLAVPRPKVLRRLWAQLAALGVGQVMLTNAARVERQYFDTHWLSPDTYVPLLIEGLQQARDTRLPIVSVHRQFRPFVEDDLASLSPGTFRLVAHPGEDRSIAGAIGAHRPSRVLLAIGPEGGWTEFERELLGAHGFTPVSMGTRTLRTDTACVAAIAIVSGLHGETRRAP
jgi:RsmE family RNA methyltransferase